MPKRKGPPICERLKTAMEASKRIRMAVKRGDKIFVNSVELERRRTICNDCENSTEREKNCAKCGQKPKTKIAGWCLDCGCWLKPKTKLATESCKYWGPDKPIKEIAK